MAKQYTLIRKIGTVPLAAGGFATLDLPRDHDYNSIFMRLAGIATVTTAATSVRAEAPTQWIQRVQLIAEGKNMLHNSPFWAVVQGAYRRKSQQNGGRSITPPTGFTAAGYPVEALGFIDFNSTDTVRSKDSAFRSYGLSLFQLQFQFGQALDIFVPGSGVATMVATVEVFSANCVEDRLPDGKYAGVPPLFLKKTTFQEFGLVNTNAALELRLPAGNLLRGVLIRTAGAVTAGEPATTQLQGIVLQNSNDIRLNLTGPQLRLKNNGDYGNVQAGYYIADMVSKGGEGNATLTDLWDVGGASEPKAILDVTGFANGIGQMIVEEYLPAGVA